MQHLTFDHAKNDGSDLRVTDDTGVLLPLWIETWSRARPPSGSKIPSIPNGGTNLYLYYGNPAAESVSNGDATFDFFDDFTATTPAGLGGNWQRVVVDNNYDGSHNVMVEDVDQDGKPDIVADAYRAKSVVWYRQPADPIHDPWTRYTIDPYLPNAHDFQIGDINGDGLQDVVGLSLSGYWGDYYQGNGSLVWYQHPTDPLAGDPPPTSGSTGWTELAALPYHQGDGSAAIYNGQIYVFGGHGDGVSDPRAETYRYNPASNTWTQLADMPRPSWGHIPVEYDSLIHIFGGQNLSGPLNQHEVYNPVTNTWLSHDFR